MQIKIPGVSPHKLSELHHLSKSLRAGCIPDSPNSRKASENLLQIEESVYRKDFDTYSVTLKVLTSGPSLWNNDSGNISHEHVVTRSVPEEVFKVLDIFPHIEDTAGAKHIFIKD